MKKITTLFKKNPDNLALVTTEVDTNNAWALTEWTATRKYDGTSCAIINGELYKRYDAKNGKLPPEWAIPCQEPDPITLHRPHRVKCDDNDKYHREAFANLNNKDDWTYELCWPRINGNREQLCCHLLIRHGVITIDDLPVRTYESIREYLEHNDIEGIVFHHEDWRMCKIRKSDYGIKR